MTKLVTKPDVNRPLDPSVASQLATWGINLARSKAEVSSMHNDIKEVWSERAAIREYLGGQERWTAEQHAVADTAEIINQLFFPGK